MQKILRSMILEQFPLDLRVQIELLSRKRGIENKAKQEELFKLLREANIDNITPLGSGTNRYAFKMNGFVIKVATDHDGKIDNLKEMKMAKRLFPDVTKIYEVSENGTLLVAEYIQPFQSFYEMERYADQIKNILKKISQVYLIGDVGLDPKNYANWGLRVGSDSPVCLDFAYIYDAKSDLFICAECNTGSMLIPNSDYTQLICPNPLCGHKYNFEDIRGRMSNEVHAQEIGDLSEESYRLSESKVLTELTPERSNYLKKKIKPKEKKTEKNTEESTEEELFKEDIKMITVKAKAWCVTTPTQIQAPVQQAPVASVTKPVEEAVPAFTGTINDEPIKVQAKVAPVSAPVVISEEVLKPIPTPVTKVEAVQEKEVISPEVHETLPVESNIPSGIEVLEDDKAWHPQQKFVDDINIVLKKLARKIQQSLYQEELWDTIRLEYMPATAKPRPSGNFYDAVQAAMFQSLSKYIKMKPIDDGETRVWICPKYEGTPYEPLLIFMERWYTNPEIFNAQGARSIEKYRKKFSDYQGLPESILIDFKRKLGGMMKDIDRDGIDIIAKKISDIWCITELREVKKDIPTPVPVPEKPAVVKATEIVEEKVSDESVNEEEMLAFSEELITKIHSNNMEYLKNSDAEDEEDSEEDDEDDMNDIEIDIYPDTDIDIIRLKFSDSYGNVEIPFYIKLEGVVLDEENPTLIDSRNGNWDWLIHIVPDLRFATKNPERWLALNNDDDFDDTVKFIVLDDCHTCPGQYLMGMYAINGVYTIDENGTSHVEKNPIVLEKLNILFRQVLGKSPISHWERNKSLEAELIRSEEYAKEILNGYIPDEDDADIDEGEEVLEDTEINESEPIDDSEELGILEPVHRKYNR